MLNKKAQIGESMTWIVATLIIIVIFTLTFYAVSILKGTKTDPSSFFSLDFDFKYNPLMDSSIFAYFQSSGKIFQSEFHGLMSSENSFKNFDSKFKQVQINLGQYKNE